MKLGLLQALKKLIFNLAIIVVFIINGLILFPFVFFFAGNLPLFMRPSVRFVFFAFRIFYGVELRISGFNHIDDLVNSGVNFVVAPKHQSVLDIFFLLLIFRKPVFVMKRELLRIPMFGLYMSLSKMIVIDRKDNGFVLLRKILNGAKEAFKLGKILIIFPEGTRVDLGCDVPYKPGVGAIYKRLNVPIVPVVSNSAQIWSKGYLFKGDGSKVLDIRILPAILPGLEYNEFMDMLKAVIDGEMKKIHSL